MTDSVRCSAPAKEKRMAGFTAAQGTHSGQGDSIPDLLSSENPRRPMLQTL